MKELCHITSFILNVPKYLCKKTGKDKKLLGILYQCKFRSILIKEKIIIYLHTYTYLNTIHNNNLVYYLLNYVVCTFSTTCQYLRFVTAIFDYDYIFYLKIIK